MNITRWFSRYNWDSFPNFRIRKSTSAKNATTTIDLLFYRGHSKTNNRLVGFKVVLRVISTAKDTGKTTQQEYRWRITNDKRNAGDILTDIVRKLQQLPFQENTIHSVILDARLFLDRA